MMHEVPKTTLEALRNPSSCDPGYLSGDGQTPGPEQLALPHSASTTPPPAPTYAASSEAPRNPDPWDPSDPCEDSQTPGAEQSTGSASPLVLNRTVTLDEDRQPEEVPQTDPLLTCSLCDCVTPRSHHTRSPASTEGLDVVFICGDCVPTISLIMAEENLSQSEATELLLNLKVVAASEEDPETRLKLFTDLLTL
jgi:hypothetical protein